MAPLLEIKNLKKSYPPQRTIFEKLFFSVEAGELAIVCGPSGAGKTTLLNLLYLAERPEGGEISLDGQPAPWLKPKQYSAWRQKIGYIFQDQKLFVDRTVFENVALPFYFGNTQPINLREEVERGLSEVGLFGQKDKYPRELSLGEKTLVNLCRALVTAPHLIIADDPLSNLDPVRADLALKLLEKEASSGRAVVLTATAGNVNSGAAKVYFIDRGTLVPDTGRPAG